MKKKIVVIVLSVFVLLNITLFISNNLLNNRVNKDNFNNSIQIKYEHMLSMMLETDNGSGEYSLEERSNWPTKEDGYIFNSTLSKCENGSKLSWDYDNNAVVFSGNVSDKCYVYFDIFVPTLADVCSSGDNLASCVKTYATTYNSDITNIYYHDSTLENGANDNSYRYAGSSATTNNYVCFGSNADTCPDDNLYRIIGVFGAQVKLIKWDYATSTLLGTDGDSNGACADNPNCNYGIRNTSYKGSNTAANIGAYYWNHANNSATYSATNYYNVWSYSKLNTVNLNTNFLNNIGTTWANKIAETTWKVGGNTYQNIYNTTAETAYKNEYVNPDTTIESTYNAKVGLMYTSDYGFAATPSAWTTTLYNYDSSSITSVNWMYMGLIEWTVVRRSDGTSYAFGVSNDGTVGDGNVRQSQAAGGARPVFHLNSSVNYVSGSGTKSEPIRIN